jgi:uncharacterized protein YndB with AHSA1/START domain
MTDLPMITLERRFRAALSDLWALWTTPAGIESWWGPPGFDVTVQEMNLTAGGTLRYTMTATAPEMVDFMQKNGMPTATPAEITYDAITPMTRISYRHLVDFVPGHPPYHTRMVVDFIPEGAAILMRLTFDQMHDAMWTERQRMGWELELSKLATVLEKRGISPS